MGAVISDLVADTTRSNTLSHDILIGNPSPIKPFGGTTNCQEGQEGFLQRMKNVFWDCKPAVIHGNLKGSPPLVLDTGKVLHNLGLGTSTSEVALLLICDFQCAGSHFHGAFASTEVPSSKPRFYKTGKLAHVLSHLPEVDKNSDSTQQKLLLANLAHLLNYATGSLWLNGLCITAPEEVDDRLQVLEVAIEATPMTISLQVADLEDIQCVRTMTRLEIYGQCRRYGGGGRTKSIWFRGDAVNCLLISPVSNGVISVILPSFQYLKEHLVC